MSSDSPLSRWIRKRRQRIFGETTFVLVDPMSVIEMFQQLPTKADVSDVQEKRRTANSHASDNQSKNGYRHSIRMPCPLRKVIHHRSEFLGTQNGKQSEREEECGHYECCGSINPTGNCRLHN